MYKRSYEVFLGEPAEELYSFDKIDLGDRESAIVKAYTKEDAKDKVKEQFPNKLIVKIKLLDS